MGGNERELSHQLPWNVWAARSAPYLQFSVCFWWRSNGALMVVLQAINTSQNTEASNLFHMTDLVPNDIAAPVHLIHGLCPHMAGQQPPEGAPASGDTLESHRDLCFWASQAGSVLRSSCCTLHLVEARQDQ